MNEEAILINVQDEILTITLNRPQVFNALRKQDKLQLAQEFVKADMDAKIKAIILYANGKAFCTGQDLNDRDIQSTGPIDLGYILQTEWNPIVIAMAKCKKPIIAAVGGVTAGAGMSIALAADIVLAAPRVKFVSGFSKIGLCPDAGATYAITKAMGRYKAMEFFLSNTPLEAQTLLQYGLINYVAEDFMQKAQSMALDFTRLPVLALAWIKKNIRETDYATFESSLKNEVVAQRALGFTSDYREGVAAFMQKRSANFKGE